MSAMPVSNDLAEAAALNVAVSSKGSIARSRFSAAAMASSGICAPYRLSVGSTPGPSSLRAHFRIGAWISACLSASFPGSCLMRTTSVGKNSRSLRT